MFSLDNHVLRKRQMIACNNNNNNNMHLLYSMPSCLICLPHALQSCAASCACMFDWAPVSIGTGGDLKPNWPCCSTLKTSNTRGVTASRLHGTTTTTTSCSPSTATLLKTMLSRLRPRRGTLVTTTLPCCHRKTKVQSSVFASFQHGQVSCLQPVL